MMNMRALEVGYRAFTVEYNGVSAAVAITNYASRLDESPGERDRWIYTIDIHDSIAGRI